MAAALPSRKKTLQPKWEQKHAEDGRRLAVAYLRVSTQIQGEEGLGMQAQHFDISNFASSNHYHVVKWFHEVQSGKHADAFKTRPVLKAAFDHALEVGATLIASKIDRLTRNPDFMGFLLTRQPVRFVIAQFGDTADRFTFRIFSVLAGEECRFISERTKAAMAQCRLQNKLIGCPKGLDRKLALPRDPIARTKDERALLYLPEISKLRDEGMSFSRVAETLNERGVSTPTGVNWTESNVSKCYTRGKAAEKRVMEILALDDIAHLSEK